MRRSLLVLLLAAGSACGQERPLSEGWSYVESMQRVAREFKGREGVVLHIGDSITYANPYSQWAVGGKGRSERDVEALLRQSNRSRLDVPTLQSTWQPAAARPPDAAASALS